MARKRDFIRNREQILANLPGTVTEIQKKLEDSITEACIRKHLQGMLSENRVSRERVQRGPKNTAAWLYSLTRTTEEATTTHQPTEVR